MYTIGQISEMFDIPTSTLRFYDKEGLFPNLVKKGNIRYFGEHELESLKIIHCLKRSGLEIKEIKEFFVLMAEGKDSYAKRKELFETRKKVVEEELEALQITLALLKFKCWYYEKAIEDGGEEKIKAMLPDKLPEEIQKFYDASHKSCRK